MGASPLHHLPSQMTEQRPVPVDGATVLREADVSASTIASLPRKRGAKEKTLYWWRSQLRGQREEHVVEWVMDREAEEIHHSAALRLNLQHLKATIDVDHDTDLACVRHFGTNPLKA